MAVSPQTSYQRAVKLHFRSWNKFELDKYREIRDEMRIYSAQIKSDILMASGGTEWDIHQLRKVQDGIERATRSLESRLSVMYDQAALEATAITVGGVDGPLSALGFPAERYPHVVDVRQLSMIRDILPEQIVDVSREAQVAVNKILRQSVLGGLDKQEVLKRIGDTVGPLSRPGGAGRTGQIISRAEVRARTIFRTEMNQIGSLTADARITELSERDPAVGKKWIHHWSREPRPTHTALHGKVIFPAKGEYFELSGKKIQGPHDPELDAKDVVNCRCKLVVHYDPENKTVDHDPVAGKTQGIEQEETPKAPEVEELGVKAKKKSDPVATLREEEGRISGNDFETAVVVDHDGNVVFSKRGKGNYVSFNKAELDQMYGRSVTHNHPQGSSFSRDDINLCGNYGLKEIRAVGKNALGENVRYVAQVSKPPGISASRFKAKVTRAYNQEKQRVLTEYVTRSRSGEWTSVHMLDMADANLYHEVWEGVASKVDWLSYSREVL